SGTLGAAGEGVGVAGPGPGGALGVGKNPTTKRCVGKPPRQAEDPMSPPCVAYFNGDNGGATYQGVTRDEITVAILWNGGGRANAATVYSKFRPFAVLNLTITATAYKDDFTDAIARKAVFTFEGTAFAGTAQTYYQRYAPLVWGFVPDVEHWAAGFVTYVCTK